MKRILVVDDSPVVLAQLCDDFAGEFEVVTASSGEEAVDILEDPVRDGIVITSYSIHYTKLYDPPSRSTWPSARRR